MNHWTTKNGYKIFQVLSGRGNVYLISAKKHNILIDTGKTNKFKAIVDNIEQLDLKDKSVSFLILTHTHFDHCQNAASLKEYFKCKIVVSEAAKEWTKNGYTPLPDGTVLFSKIISGLGKTIGNKKFGYTVFEPDTFLSGDMTTLIPTLDIQIIETKGHSEDSVSILVDDEIALVGDAMFGIFRDSVFPPFANSTSDMIKSWGKLLDTGCSTFLPGHGRAISNELLEQQYEKYDKKYNMKSSV
jgi:hydroxyacylglutathione hydrolase